MMNREEKIIEITKDKQTASRHIKIVCKATRLNTEEVIPYIDHEQIIACKEGCPNYGKKWSCPPYSKDYLKLKKDYKYAYLIALSTQMEQYLDIKNKYLAMKAANVTLKSLVEKAARYLEEEWEGYALLSGSCRLCKPCNCKLGKPCKNPDKMRYSMEATHLDVSGLMKDKMQYPLLWYTNKILPKYTTTVAMVLTNRELEATQLQMILENIIS